MIQGIIGIKKEQSRTFTEDGRSIPVTNILTGPLFVVRIKTKDTDGYDAIQFGIGSRRLKTIAQPQSVALTKAGLDKTPPRFLKEVRIDAWSDDEKNAMIPGGMIATSSILKAGDVVKVTGVSKGKGFAGVVKRHHFRGGPRTHGQSDRERAPGSIGQTTTPGRVYRGKRMAGRMGNAKTTVKSLKVVSVNDDKHTVTISGLVPGGRNSLLVIQKV